MKPPANSQELVAAALAAGDPYAAAAVYAVAGEGERSGLEALMFGERRNTLMFARWERTPAAVLQTLAARPDGATRARLERNPGTPEQALQSLYRAENQSALVGLIAQHRHTPASVLEQIAAAETDTKILKAMSANPAAGPQALRLLADRFADGYDAELAANAATPADVLERIYRRGNPFVRAAVVAHAACPDSVVTLACNEQQGVILRYLARDSRVALPVLGRLACHAEVAVRRNVAANPALPAALVLQMARDEAAAVRRTLAGRADLPADAMVWFASDEDAWVRSWLARNPGIEQALLLQLAEDDEVEVRRAVARNPACPAVFLQQLAADAQAWVRAAVAYQPNASAALLQMLAADSAIDVLSGVAANAHTPQDILRRLAQSDEADVRRGVILNPGAARATLQPLLEDPYFLHRVLLVGTPQLADSDKWGLRDDPDHAVRFEVFRWFAGRQQPGACEPDEVVYGMTKEKDREDIGCS